LTAVEASPLIVLVAPVTVKTSCANFPSLTPRKTNVVPGTSGNQGLSTRLTKLRGSGPDVGAKAATLSVPSTNRTPSTIIVPRSAMPSPAFLDRRLGGNSETSLRVHLPTSKRRYRAPVTPP